VGNRTDLVAAVSQHVDRICEIVAADVGEPAADLRADVELTLRLLSATDREAGSKRARAEFMKRGVEAAEAGTPSERMIDRFMSTMPAIWEVARDLRPSAAALEDLVSWLLHGADLAAAAISEGYTGADRAIVVRDATARRAFLEELLWSVALDAPAEARLRRLAVRYGLNPAGSYRIVAISPHRDTVGDEAHELADRLGQRLGSRSTIERGLGANSGVLLPQVLARQRRMVVLARADWTGIARLRQAMDHVMPGWTAVSSRPVEGVDALSPALAHLMDTLRAADRMSRTGWIEDPDDLAVERLLLLDESVLEAVVRRELGPLLETPRMGPELVLTLQSYFESGENMRETSRTMNLATRTIAYRLTRVEEILGRPLDGEMRSRLAVALFAYRVLGDRAPSPPDGLQPDV
jgi:hypothetical protein